ncbi:MAG: pyridoxal phosphate-dependent aminotransferase [Thermoplasmata archaeon]
MIDFKSSPTIEIVNKIHYLKERGEKIISLAVGDPDLPTPRGIINAAVESMNNEMTHYAPSAGLENFRSSACLKARRKNRIYAKKENVIFISAKHSIYSTFLSMKGRRNEILIPDPGYFYQEPALLAGMKPVYYKHDIDFNIDVEDIRHKINHRTAAIVINSPSNPTGKIADKDQLKSIFEISEKNGIYIISDEAYEDVTYEKNSVSIGSVEKNPYYVVSIFSLSKSFSMTGWRAGYTIANDQIIRKISKVMENTFTSYPPFIQEASAFALSNGENYIMEMKEIMLKRRNFVLETLEDIPSLEMNKIEGTFYAFPKLKGIQNSESFARELLDKKKVAVLPGSVFGNGGKKRIRISFSVSLNDLSTGLDNLKKFMGK